MSRAPDSKGERVEISKRRILVRKRRSEREHGEEKMDYAVKEGGFQGGKPP